MSGVFGNPSAAQVDRRRNRHDHLLGSPTNVLSFHRYGFHSDCGSNIPGWAPSTFSIPASAQHRSTAVDVGLNPDFISGSAGAAAFILSLTLE